MQTPAMINALKSANAYKKYKDAVPQSLESVDNMQYMIYTLCTCEQAAARAQYGVPQAKKKKRAIPRTALHDSSGTKFG